MELSERAVDAKPLANKDFIAVKVRVDADEDYTAQIEIPIKPQNSN